MVEQLAAVGCWLTLVRVCSTEAALEQNGRVGVRVCEGSEGSE